MIRRLLSVLVAVPLILAVLFSPWPILFKLLVQICIFFSLQEYFSLIGFSFPEKVFGIGLGMIHSVLIQFVPLEPGFLLLETAGLVILPFVFYLRFHGELAGSVTRIALMVTGFFYIATVASLVGLLRDFFEGSVWVLLLFAMTWSNDTFAYFVGHQWGRRKLAAQISPGKTFEGYWGGLVGTFFGFFLVSFLFSRPVPLGVGMVMALMVGLVAPLGDLSESLLKRSFGVKDSGHLIPGHGGILDRIDALLFAAPIVYGFALFFS